MGNLAWAPRLLGACFSAHCFPAPSTSPAALCAKCEHELAIQPALTFHPLGRMAIFVLWHVAGWSLHYPHSCQLSPVALLWEEATNSPSQDPNQLESRAQGEKESRRAGKEPAGAGRAEGSPIEDLLPAGTEAQGQAQSGFKGTDPADLDSLVTEQKEPCISRYRKPGSSLNYKKVV